jgi:hypothetical protein
MKRKISAALLTVLFAGAVFSSLGFLVACGGSNSSSAQSGDVITATQPHPASETVGQNFQLLQATVTDNGTAVSGVTVTFTAPTSGASGKFANGTNTTTATTNANGLATATTFTANTVAGAYSVTASVSGVANSASFNLTNTAGPAATITATAGATQSAAAGANFATALQATVVDSFKNPVSGASVAFAAPASGASGAFGASGTTTTVTSSTTGVVTAPAFTAGGVLGTYTVTATVTGVTSASGSPIVANFTLTNLTGAAAVITASSGSPQYTTVGTAFPKTLQATVTDNFSNPVSGATVTFTIVPSSGATGTFASTATATTDTTGLAISPVFTANSVAGCYSVTASTSGVTTSASYSLNNVVPAVAAVSGTTPQSATVSTAFADALQASVTANACGTVVPLTGITVTFTAPGTGASGTFATGGDTTTAISNALGIATAADFTANSTAGSYSVSASAPSASNTGSFSLKNTALTSLANGNYVFYVSGFNTLDYQYSLAGVITVASGAITAGELDYVDYLYAENDSINPSTSSISQNTDGNFVITLATCDGSDCSGTDVNIGENGVVTLDAAMLPASSSQKAFVTEFDASASGSGMLDLQSSPSVAQAGYAFGLNGLDTFGNPIAIDGVVDIGQCSATALIPGSVFDANDDMTIFAEETFAGCNVSSADSFNRVVLTLSPTDNSDFPQILLAGYIVDANHIRLVETNDAYLGDLGGTAFNQGANTGSFSSSSVSGTNYVVALNGSDSVGALQAVALLTFNAGGTVSGSISFNDLTSLGPNSASTITGGTYTVDGPTSGQPDAGTGRVTLTGITATDSYTTHTVTFNLELYLDGNGDATAASMDTTDVLGGLGFQQTGGPFGASMFTSAYALNVTGWDKNRNGEFDATGPVTATGSSDTFSGTVDLNWLTSAGPTYTAAPVSGTYASNPTGVFTGTITGLDVTDCKLFTPSGSGCTADNFNYYLIDAAGESVVIETDGNQLTLGYFFQQ